MRGRWAKRLLRKPSEATRGVNVASIGEETLLLQIRARRLPTPEREFRFHPTRKWRSDFYWPDYNLIVEVEGRGRHQSFVGYRNDCEKYNAISMMGYVLLRFTTEMVKTGLAIHALENFMMESNSAGKKIQECGS